MMGMFAGVLGVMGVAIWMLFSAYTSAVESRVKYQVAAETERVTREYQEKTAKLSQGFADQMAVKDAAVAKTLGEKEREINAMRSSYESQLRAKPFHVGNDFERRLALVMCHIGSPDAGARKTCDLSAGAPYAPDTALVVTVTAKDAEYWQDQCQEGQRDYCDYAIVGMTAQGALTILDWLNRVDAYQQRLLHYADQQDQAITMLTTGTSQ